MFAVKSISSNQSVYLSLARIMLLAGCSSDPMHSQKITQERCEAQSGFVFVAAGPFQAGSDPEQRDYGYQISAEAMGDTPDAIRHRRHTRPVDSRHILFGFRLVME
jgi:hypothetical protein